MVETAPAEEDHKAASPKPTRVRREAQTAPTANDFLKNSQKLLYAFRCRLPQSRALSLLPNYPPFQKGLDVKAQLLVGSTPFPERWLQKTHAESCQKQLRQAHSIVLSRWVARGGTAAVYGQPANQVWVVFSTVLKCPYSQSLRPCRLYHSATRPSIGQRFGMIGLRVPE